MLINLRNALMTGKRLPYDAEVEYLESTGKQWITIPITIESTDTIGATFTPRASSSNGAIYCSSFGNRGNLLRRDRSGNLSIFSNGGSNTVSSYVVGTEYTVVWGNRKVSVNGTPTTVPYNIYLVVSPETSISLFTTATGTLPGYCAISHFYVEGKLDLIPVRKGTVGYLYDRVSGKLFGNAGTGDFVLGPDVVPVEWMEGGRLDSGIAFIDTGYTPNSSTKIASTSAILSAQGYSGRFGNQSRLTFGVSNGRLYLAQGNHYFLGGYTAGTFYSFVNDIANRTVSVEGVGSTSTAAVSDWYPQLYPIYLFASNVAPTTGTNVNGKWLDSNSLGQIRMKSCSIWENDIPVLNYRPVRVGTEGAMMDVLTRRIYRNQGTGAFTYGNDLKYPIPAE